MARTKTGKKRSTPSTPDILPEGVHGAPPEEALARFFGYSHDILAILDGPGRVLVISPSVERVLGYPPSDLIGQPLIDWVHPEDQTGVKTQARTLLAGKRIGDLDVRLSNSDGGWVPMRWSLSAGHDRKVYAVGRDHTAQAQSQEAFLRKEMAELQLRTAMELHDGILQTLTGATLQIAVARRLLHDDPSAAEQVLEGLGSSISAEQQEMRLYVDELKGIAPAWTDETRGLSQRVDGLLNRVGMIWGLKTSARVRLRSELGGELARQILRIIQEGTVNAARHGGAKTVSVALDQDAEEITISLLDDGKGFPFQGFYDYEALKRKRLGPLSLKHRVGEAGGDISINSTPKGAKVEIRLPSHLGDNEE